MFALGLLFALCVYWFSLGACSLAHCSGVNVFCENAWMVFNSSARVEFTRRWRCNIDFPSNSFDTIITLNLPPQPSDSSTTCCWQKSKKRLICVFHQNRFFLTKYLFYWIKKRVYCYFFVTILFSNMLTLIQFLFLFTDLVLLLCDLTRWVVFAFIDAPPNICRKLK